MYVCTIDPIQAAAAAVGSFMNRIGKTYLGANEVLPALPR